MGKLLPETVYTESGVQNLQAASAEHTTQKWLHCQELFTGTTAHVLFPIPAGHAGYADLALWATVLGSTQHFVLLCILGKFSPTTLGHRSDIFY